MFVSSAEFEAHEEEEHFIKKKCRYCLYATAYDIRMDAHIDDQHPGKVVMQNRPDFANIMTDDDRKDFNVDALEPTQKVNTLLN